MKLARLGLASLALCGLWLSAQQGAHRAFEPSIGRRLLGPVAQLAAGWQWVRVRVAADEGRLSLAYARAELALDLDPQATGGWAFLASMLAFDRASPYREQDPRLRQSWTEAAIELLLRGESRALHPAELAMQRGIILVHVADSQGAIPWPAGLPGAWRAAQSAFERATELDPGWSQPWAQLAANQCWGLGSPGLGSQASERLAAGREALAWLEQGLKSTRKVAPLYFQRGMLLSFIAEGPDGASWPGGPEALYSQAIEAFQSAEDQHFPMAPDARAAAEQALGQVRSR